jgi:capsule polysaccharide export protein KpsE/RkpR
MPDLPFLRAEIERMRYQLQRQRKEIRALQKAGIPTKSAEEHLERMQVKIDALCAERDRQRDEQCIKYPGTDKPIRGVAERRYR